MEIYHNVVWKKGCLGKTTLKEEGTGKWIRKSGSTGLLWKVDKNKRR